ncbi:ABC transporter permease [Youxingia wuxianensis]|uniref:Autoinducer 2 import system permease protein LsrD n=1 Tax=Youxingia wuxianensis TaxID=2763678 RepID=A0A926ESF2_9FIRM|nr:ABC transporter permease [Youxingia wuxianensis]MBC8585430.1 ABC transporter permease [Youxingia wuxianensis]
MGNQVELSKENKFAGTVKKLLSANGAGVVLAYAVLVIFLSIATPYFFTLDNILIVIRQAVWVAIMGIGMTFIIAMGGIDLSVGAILGICGVIVAALIKGGMNIYLALIIALVAGMCFGFINGLLITKLRLAEFIATLGTMSILRGIIMVYTQGIPVYGLRFPEFQFLAQGFIGFVPFPIIILLVLLGIFYILMYRTRLGRYTLSIGSNEDAAKLVGINIDRVKLTVYTLTGLLCAISGILLTSRSEAAVAEAGNGYELDVIAATVIGGTSMSGGKANLVGTIIGAILMATVRNGLNLLQVSPLWHQVVIGAFIIVAVSMDTLSAKRHSNQ